MATDVHIEETLPELTDRIVQTYSDLGTITHLGHCPLPSYETIVEILESLKDIIFPGYRRRDGLHLGNITYHVGDVIDRLHDQLTEQIARALRHEAGEEFTCGPQQKADFEALGQAKAVAFLQQIPAVRALLATDVQAAYDGDPACKSLDEVIFCYPGLEAITVYRLAHLLYKLEVPLIPRIMTEWAHSRTGIDIHPGAVDRQVFLHRPRHGRGHRADDRDRRLGQALPGRDARRLELRHRCRGEPRARDQAPSHDRGPRGDLRQRHGAGRQDGRGASRRDRIERLDHELRDAACDRDPREAAVERARPEFRGRLLDLASRSFLPGRTIMAWVTGGLHVFDWIVAH